MHFLCEPICAVPVELPVEFTTIQDLLTDEPACRVLWDLVSSQFSTRSKFLAIWAGVRYAVLHRDESGAVNGFLLITTPVNWQLDYVVVCDRARGQGIASALVRTALNEACRRRVPYVMLSAAASLRPLYEACGFVPVPASSLSPPSPS
ncbi:MAG: N-acetyltransferase [Planctomycetota bacterium]|nr:MAG: N-acetyltransferase [Planctomycetota bacterium]